MKLEVDLAEQLLIVLAFHEAESPILEGIITEELFEGHLGEIAKRLLNYRKEYKTIPSKGIYSLFSDLQDAEAWDTYRDTLIQMEENKDRVAPKFVLDKVGVFVKRQNLKRDVMDAMRIIQSEEGESEEGLARIESILSRSRTTSQAFFDAGVGFSDVDNLWGETEEQDSDIVLTKIAKLDIRRLGPRRGQLHLLVAPAKMGKTWWGVHLTKCAAVIQKKAVLFLTLEISAEEIMRRLHCSMFGIRRNEARKFVTKFEKDDLGRITDVYTEEGKTGLVVSEEDFVANLEDRIRAWKDRANIIVKEFPSGTLTVPVLDAYLGQLAVSCNFRPDLVVLDYADLMKASSENLRIELERLFVDLRGLAQQRNFALVTMSQANREGAKSKSGVGVQHVAESWAKIATADTVLTLSKTEEETKHGLARLRVAASRVGQDGFTVILSQDYDGAQFVVDQGTPTQQMFERLASSDED